MSLDVALQSVAFYVLSCSTCAKINHRRKAKIQAKRDKAEKHELETEQPGLYRHPSPFSTNPYWSEEILMGPGPPNKKGDRSGSKNASTRALNTAGPGSSYASSGAVSTDIGSSSTVVTEGSRISGEGWNLKRYQREDEALWGHGDGHGPGQRIMDAIAKAGSSAGRLLESRLSKAGTPKEENPENYYIARNPPVNDLHPPVVSTQPRNRDQTRWMLQPPPAAKIMEGKERVDRRRSGSGASRKALDGTPLGRQVTERLVEAKLQRGEIPTYPESRSISRSELRSNPLASTHPTGQPHDRDTSASSDSSDSLEEGIKRKRRPPPISTSSIGRRSKDTVEHIPIPSTTPTAPAGADLSFRPQLATIASSSNMVPQVPSEETKQLRQLPLRELDNALNSRAPSPSTQLSPQVNSMPTSIPSVETKFPGAQTHTFPKSASQENSEPARSLNP